MAIEMFVSGNLSIDPIEREERGVTYIAFTLATNVNSNSALANNGRETIWVDANVAGQKMLRAVRLKKGDGVWVRGPVTIREYTAGNKVRRSYQMHVNELITAKEVHEA